MREDKIWDFSRYKEKIDEFKKAKALLINYEKDAEVTLEFKQQAISLLSEKNESNYSRRLLPFVYNMFGMKNESIKQKNLLLSTIQDETYCRWLEQISTDNLTSAASPQE